MESNTVVHVVDDDDAILDSVSLLLDSIGVKCHVYKNAELFLNAYSDESFDINNGCILLDIRMPIMSGIECQHRLLEMGSSMPIIFLTGHADVPTAVEAMKKGAMEFIQKPFREQDLIEAIQKAIQKSLDNLNLIEKTEAIQAKLNSLTSREKQILEAVIAGKSNKKIANKLHLSQRTVEIHRAHVMEKMDAKSLAELVKMVIAASPSATK